MLKASDMLTWQGLRAACEWDAQHFDARVFRARGRQLTPMDLMDSVQVGKPGPVEGEPWWRDTTNAVHAGRIRTLYPPLRTQPPAHSVVFCAQAWMEPYRHTVRQWTGPITLVTMCSDEGIHRVAVDQLITRGPVETWYAVQVQTRHPQLVPMPLGLDAWMVPALERAVNRAWIDRDLGVYVNCRILGRSERDACVGYWKERPDAAVLSFDAQTPERYATDLGRSRFVVSPPGLGWDCFRTYEAIVMGAIPIVLKRPPASDVLDGLPVLMVETWDDCTPERLAAAEKACAAIRARAGWDAPLRLSTWVERLYGARERLERQHEHDHDSRDAGARHCRPAAEPASVQR